MQAFTEADVTETVLLAKRRLEERRIALAETSFREFIRQAWPSIEPGAEFVPNWHIDAIADHLQATLEGKIRLLSINIPPRSMKSSICAVMFPAWVWIRNPEKKFLYASYDLKLSKRHSRICRDLIKSPWYQRHWGGRYSISKIQDQKERFDNSATGFRMATAVDAGTTGDGADFFFYDDLNDVRQMNSEAYVEGVIYYHDHVSFSRLNNPKTGIRVSIQQRCGERDITGHVTASEEGWECIVIKNEYEGPQKPTVLGWVDPRTEIGELFWPARIGPEETAKFKKKGSYAGQYQQRPAAAEGAKFKREWWKFYNKVGVSTENIHLETSPGKFVDYKPTPIPSAFEQIVHGWDFAFKDQKENDLAAGHVWGRVGSNVFLLARKTGHWDFPETLRQVKALSNEFPCPEKMIEDKANGPAVIQSLRNQIPGLIESPVDGGLIALTNSITGYVEAGNVFLPNPDIYPWVKDLIDQFAAYPSGAHDDDIAAACHALRRLFDSAANSGLPEFRVLPRLGEPESASHVVTESKMSETLEPYWRRFVAISPGHGGAAVWICETPTKSLRVYREASISGLDGRQVGAMIAEKSLADVIAYQKMVRLSAKFTMNLLMEPECFAPIESIGCYAELVEDGIMKFKPDAEGYDARVMAEDQFRQSRFVAEQVSLEDSAYDHLRELLRFAPPDFKELPYDRTKAMYLARTDDEAYQKYMNAVEGKVYGEWPKIKVAESCKSTIAALGSSRREDGAENHFLRAVLLGMGAPKGLPMKSTLELNPLVRARNNNIRSFGVRRRRIA